MCPVVVVLNCEDPKFIENVQVTYVCAAPFSCSEPTICLDSINGTEIVENQVFLTSDADITETRVKILITVTDNTGKVVVLSKNVLLPLSVYCTPVESHAENHLILRIETNQACLEFSKIFTGKLQ